jgi:hypothetical protein
MVQSVDSVYFLLSISNKNKRLNMVQSVGSVNFPLSIHSSVHQPERNLRNLLLCRDHNYLDLELSLHLS